MKGQRPARARPPLRLVVDNGARRPRPPRLDETRRILRSLWAGLAWKG